MQYGDISDCACSDDSTCQYHRDGTVWRGQIAELAAKLAEADDSLALAQETINAEIGAHNRAKGRAARAEADLKEAVALLADLEDGYGWQWPERLGQKVEDFLARVSRAAGMDGRDG